MRPRFQNTRNYALQTQLTVYTLEMAIASMDRSCGVEQLVMLIDFHGYSIWNAPPMSQTREVLSILMDHYPERLGPCAPHRSAGARARRGLRDGRTRRPQAWPSSSTHRFSSTSPGACCARSFRPQRAARCVDAARVGVGSVDAPDGPP